MKHRPAPSASCRYFTADDALRFALAAYYAASQQMEPPLGEPWEIDGQPYASAADFADSFVQEICDRVSAAALTAKIERHGSEIMGNWWPNEGDELTNAGATFLRRIMKHLPPEEIDVHNRILEGLGHAE